MHNEFINLIYRMWYPLSILFIFQLLTILLSTLARVVKSGAMNNILNVITKYPNKVISDI